jgi:hypothetical protein
MVEQTTDQQMEEVLNVTGDDPLSDAMGDRLVTQQTSMLADVAGKDGYIYEPDQKLDYRDTMGLLFPITPNDPIFDDIKKMFEEEAYGPAIATSALATLAVIPGFGRLPKSAAKKIARETAESLKKSESKVAPDMEQLEKLYDASVKNKERSKTPRQRLEDAINKEGVRMGILDEEPTLNIPPAPPKRNRLTEQNTYDLPINQEIDDFIVGEDNYYSKLFDGILGLESSKLVDKNGNIKVTVFEKWLSENAPAGQAKYTGLQNLVDNAKKEGVEKLSVRNDIANRYMNNEIRLSENILRFNPNDRSIDKYGRLLDIPHNVSDPKYLYYSDHNNRQLVGGGGSNFTSNNITIDPTINQDYDFYLSRSKKESFSENTLYPNIEPLVDVRNYEEMIVGLPALPKDTTVSVSPLPRTKTKNPEKTKTFPTRKDYTHDHYQNELTNLFHIRYTKNADIGDGKSDTFIWHEGQSDIAQRRQYVEYNEDGNPLINEDGNIITRPVVTQIDKTNPKTGIARSLETRFREAEVADELLQKRKKAMEDMAMIVASRRGQGKTEPYFPNPDYFEKGSDLRDRIKEGLGDVSFSERSISRVHDNIDSTLAAEIGEDVGGFKGFPTEIQDIQYMYRDPGDIEPKRILPEIPFLKGDEADKSKITNLMFQRALKQAIDSGHDKFAWPTSETIRKFSGGSNAPTGVLKTYDVDFINMAKKIYNGTKKPKDPAFEEWWRMEERVRPISFEGTFKIKDDVSRNDLFEIAESIELALNKKQKKIFDKMQELKTEKFNLERTREISKEQEQTFDNLQKVYENQFQKLTVAGNPILYRINEFKKNIRLEGAGEEARQNLIKEINNMYGKPSGIKLKKEFKPHAIPGSKDKKDPTKPIIVENLMPHIEDNPLVGDLGKNANIQNYYVMEITPEMKAMFSKGIGFKKGGIVQNKMDSQMSDLFGEEQVA